MTGPASSSRIRAVILFGSYGRGDAVSDSDVDVCIITKDEEKQTEESVRHLVPCLPCKLLKLVSYSQEAVARMCKYGSLFLWHLKLEGQVLYGEEYVKETLQKLKPFKRHRYEILYHKHLLSDLQEAMDGDWTPNELDLSLLFTIARNTCMIISHKRGTAVFGRYDCYKSARTLFSDLPLSFEIYLFLSKWKTIYERFPDTNAELPDRNNMDRLVSEIQRLLDYAYGHTE